MASDHDPVSRSGAGHQTEEARPRHAHEIRSVVLRIPPEATPYVMFTNSVELKASSRSVLSLGPPARVRPRVAGDPPLVGYARGAICFMGRTPYQPWVPIDEGGFYGPVSDVRVVRAAIASLVSGYPTRRRSATKRSHPAVTVVMTDDSQADREGLGALDARTKASLHPQNIPKRSGCPVTKHSLKYHRPSCPRGRGSHWRSSHRPAGASAAGGVERRGIGLFCDRAVLPHAASDSKNVM